MSCLSDLSGCELVTLANIVSVALSQGLNSEELATLAAFFTIIGDSLAALAIKPNL